MNEREVFDSRRSETNQFSEQYIVWSEMIHISDNVYSLSTTVESRPEALACSCLRGLVGQF